MKYSVVIPVYRSSASLPKLLKEISTHMDVLGDCYEIILVEDDGGDDSWEVMNSQLSLYPQLCIIKLMRNFGQHNALMCSFAQSNGEWVVTLDDDLQNPPEEISLLIDKAKEGFDVVYGVPQKKEHHTFRNFGSFIVRKFYQKIFHTNIFPSSFRLIHRNVIKGIIQYNKNFTLIDGLIHWYTSNIGEVVVRHNPREAGSSGYTTGKLLTLSLNMLTNFSIFPLQLVSLCGLFFSLGGFFLSFWFIAKYFITGIPIPGYTSTFVAVTLFAGMQMLSLGLIGEYLGRIHLNINTKPQYFVRKKVCKDGS